MAGGRSWGARPPAPGAYFAALGVVLLLLLLLLLYCFYFCLTRVKELSGQDLSSPVPSTPGPSAYPVRAGVRESAQAMARLCRHLPRASSDAHADATDSPDTHTTNDASVSSQVTSDLSQTANDASVHSKTISHLSVPSKATSDAADEPCGAPLAPGTRRRVDSSLTSVTSHVTTASGSVTSEPAGDVTGLPCNAPAVAACVNEIAAR